MTNDECNEALTPAGQPSPFLSLPYPSPLPPSKYPQNGFDIEPAGKAQQPKTSSGLVLGLFYASPKCG